MQYVQIVQTVLVLVHGGMELWCRGLSRCFPSVVTTLKQASFVSATPVFVFSWLVGVVSGDGEGRLCIFAPRFKGAGLQSCFGVLGVEGILGFGAHINTR